MYQITRGTDAERKIVTDWLFGLDRMSAETADKVVTAWVTAIGSSPYATLEDIPYSVAVPSYGMARHINEVTRVGLDLAAQAQALWGYQYDPDILLPILILHDLDKPLIYAGDRTKAEYSALGRQLPHGVVAGMMLRELGFDHVIVSTVATHAANAPFHGENPEAWVLHYADMFSTDHANGTAGLKPFYQQHLSV